MDRCAMIQQCFDIPKWEVGYIVCTVLNSEEYLFGLFGYGMGRCKYKSKWQITLD